MYGRNVHLFAAAAVVFTVAGATLASAGIIDGSGCCAPVRWSCGTNCGPMPTVTYGVIPEPDYDPRPVYRVDQGPDYLPPLLGYGEPRTAPDDDQGPYPYLAPYSGYGYPFMFQGNRRHGVNIHRHFGVAPYRHFRPRFVGGPRMQTAMVPNRFVGHRPMTRMPMVRRPMVRGRH